MRLTKKNRWVLGIVAIFAVVVGIGFITLPAYMVYFYTPAEARADAMNLSVKQIKLAGMVMPGSIQKDTEAMSFMVSDLKGTDIAVSYRGSAPDMFKENAGVVLIGKINQDGKSFVAKEIMAKHSEEYMVPSKDHPELDTKLLEKSLFKE